MHCVRYVSKARAALALVQRSGRKGKKAQFMRLDIHVFAWWRKKLSSPPKSRQRAQEAETRAACGEPRVHVHCRRAAYLPRSRPPLKLMDGDQLASSRSETDIQGLPVAGPGDHSPVWCHCYHGHQDTAPGCKAADRCATASTPTWSDARAHISVLLYHSPPTSPNTAHNTPSHTCV